MSKIRQPIDARQSCTFCGKSVDEVGVLIILAPASICDGCVAEFQKFIDGFSGRRQTMKPRAEGTAQ